MKSSDNRFAEKRRILQLETLYDLALALHAHKPEQELADDLLQRVCAVLDPAAAVAVTRDPFGSARAVASVGWTGAPPEGASLVSGSLWKELLASGQSVSRRDGELAGRAFEQLVATPLSSRGVFMGYLAVLDKEVRSGESVTFTREDRRFLKSVASLAGVALDRARQVETLAVERERLEEENKLFKDRFARDIAGHRVVAHAPPIRRVLELVERVAPRGVSVLLRGESGTGKELITKILHILSGRSGSLVALNCAALPESLLESELFGIEGGVATGVEARRGKLELAHEGTLFLDEIGDMDSALQVKLLRVLQEREVVRVGGHQAVPVDVRLVAATHQDLEELIQEGRFREDLYYRIKGVEIAVPALRERREDIPHLIRYFSEEFCRREEIPVPQFSQEALALLLSYDYPGNVRELQNLVEGAVSLSEGAIDRELVQSLLNVPATAPAPEALELAAAERRHIARVLEITGGNKSRAARLLGVDRRTLQRKGF